jgi:hypothetical protein
MKITKRQLKRIIREEKARLLEMLGTPEQQRAAAEYSRKQRAGKKPKVNMAFQMNDPGDGPDPENDMGLYVNLSDDQLDALDALQNALEMCRTSNVASADIMDTVQAGLGS